MYGLNILNSLVRLFLCRSEKVIFFETNNLVCVEDAVLIDELLERGFLSRVEVHVCRKEKVTGKLIRRYVNDFNNPEVNGDVTYSPGLIVRFHADLHKAPFSAFAKKQNVYHGQYVYKLNKPEEVIERSFVVFPNYERVEEALEECYFAWLEDKFLIENVSVKRVDIVLYEVLSELVSLLNKHNPNQIILDYGDDLFYRFMAVFHLYKLGFVEFIPSVSEKMVVRLLSCFVERYKSKEINQKDVRVLLDRNDVIIVSKLVELEYKGSKKMFRVGCFPFLLFSTLVNYDGVISVSEVEDMIEGANTVYKSIDYINKSLRDDLGISFSLFEISGEYVKYDSNLLYYNL